MASRSHARCHTLKDLSDDPISLGRLVVAAGLFALSALCFWLWRGYHRKSRGDLPPDADYNAGLDFGYFLMAVMFLIFGLATVVVAIV